MKILFLAEENSGGGAVSNTNLVLAITNFAQVAFFGIDYNLPENNLHIIYSTKARRAVSLRYCLDCWKSLNKFDPDIVHATGMYTGLIAILFRFLGRKGYRIIMTLRHTSNKFRFNFLSKRFIRVLNRADIIHYLTEYQKRFYWDYGLRPNKFKVISNIIVPKIYSTMEVEALRKKLLAYTSSERIIGYVGRLVESKQLRIFIEVIKILNQNDLNVGGVIVGKGEENYTDSLRNYANERNITSKLTFVGFSNQPELYIKACDFGLFPTLGEALPRFIIESFSQHKTIVVSNHPSIRSIITHLYDSLVVSDHEPDSYAYMCMQLIKNHQLQEKLESGAKTTYSKQYEADFVINEYKKMYSEILQR